MSIATCGACSALFSTAAAAVPLVTGIVVVAVVGALCVLASLGATTKR